MRTMLIMLTSKIQTPRNLFFVNIYNTVFPLILIYSYPTILIILIVKLTTEQALFVNIFSKYKNVFSFNNHTNFLLLNWIIELTNETSNLHELLHSLYIVKISSLVYS